MLVCSFGKFFLHEENIILAEKTQSAGIANSLSGLTLAAILKNMPKFDNRQIVIEKTLFIESLTSKLIKHMMGLDLYGNTKTLDNKSSSISLRAKIDLLNDCDKIDKQTYTNLLHIISIRNQFAHNFECDNFEDLSKFIDGIDKPLLRYCSELTNSHEENLKVGFLNMLDQAFQFLRNEFTGVTKEFQLDAAKVKIRISETEEGLLNQWGFLVQETEQLF